MSKYSVIGQRVHRVDGPEKITGNAKYTLGVPKRTQKIMMLARLRSKIYFISPLNHYHHRRKDN